METLGKYRYVLKQRLKDGTLWTCSVVSEGEYRHVCQAVIAGYLPGEPRWAETSDDSENPGFLIYGIDRRGCATDGTSRRAHEGDFA